MAAPHSRKPAPAAKAGQHPTSHLPKGRFSDRELSWLDFNQRVLELADDPRLALLERVNFLAIFTSNLDEFFMVRVAGLKRRIATKLAVTGVSGLTPLELLSAISKETHRLLHRQSDIFHQQIEPALRREGIDLVHWNDLAPAEAEAMGEYFSRNVFTILPPLAGEPAHPLPYLSGLSLNLAVIVRDPKTSKREFARVKVPQSLPRFVRIASRADSLTFLPLEDLLRAQIGQLFPGMEVVTSNTFRVTRNEDLEVDEDEAENLLQALEKELLRRRFGPPVRLELDEDVDPAIRELLVTELGVEEEDVYELPSPLDMTGLFQIAGINHPELHYPVAVPVTNRFLADIEPHEHNEFLSLIHI